MPMPPLTVAAGAALIAVGVGLGLISGAAPEDASFMAKYSKYIPAVFGALIAVCGLVAFVPSARKHAIHVALLFAVLGVLGGAGRLPETLTAEDFSFIALMSQLGLLLVCLAYLVLGVKSFLKARRERKLAATGEPAAA